ncbi:MAG TPA: flagellar hook basal-body protein [Sedimentisphaerales bacterium]|nr:flagellar hook basal-body protein [Sedimentisphaerales bacterium]HNU27771.1 flagellar hook basal-body protein [Sedimentisphaerales bacterium]
MTDIGAQVGASLNALTQQLDVIAHNVANVSTAGFKRRCNSFTQVLAAQEAAQGEGEGKQGESQGLFDFSQGSLVQTARTLDFALHGDGFFVIETPAGPEFTRHGVFTTNQNGQIVDTAGRLVAGTAGPLILPPEADITDLSVSDSGLVVAGQTTIGQLRIVDFPGERDKLVPVGQNCFKTPEDVDPVEATDVVVKQGYQEASNVKLIDELVNMILVSRMYESNMRLVSVKRESTTAALGVAMG